MACGTFGAVIVAFVSFVRGTSNLERGRREGGSGTKFPLRLLVACLVLFYIETEEIVYKQGMEHGGPLKRLGAETDGRTGGPAQFHLSNRCLPGMPHPMCVDSVYRWQVSINLRESSLVI